MKIIADTNIWYELGEDKDLYEKVKELSICPTFPNIHELSKTENLIEKEEFTRNAIRMLFRFQRNAIFEPPFIYLAKLNQDFDYDIQKEIGHWLNFTSKFAKGFSIDPKKEDTFRKEIKDKRAQLEDLSNFFNEEAEKIRQRIIDKKKHKRINTFQITGGFLNFCVEQTTNKKANLEDFDMEKAELLVKTLDYFFKTLEVSHMKVQANDWYDFAILAYVQPGDKYWTREKRWKRLIEEAGCKDYLYEE